MEANVRKKRLTYHDESHFLELNSPSGWENRHNIMSEHNMKLGGMAATKFMGVKNAYEGDFGVTIDYKNSDQV